MSARPFAFGALLSLDSIETRANNNVADATLVREYHEKLQHAQQETAKIQRVLDQARGKLLKSREEAEHSTTMHMASSKVRLLLV